MDIAEILMGAERNSGPEIRVDKDAQIMTLREVFSLYHGGNPFSPGDIVTPRPNSEAVLPGQPCIVLEVFDPETVSRREDKYDSFKRHDMRILRVVSNDGDCGTFSVESWMFEPWRNS